MGFLSDSLLGPRAAEGFRIIMTPFPDVLCPAVRATVTPTFQQRFLVQNLTPLLSGFQSAQPGEELCYVGVFRRQGGFFVLLFLFFAEKPYVKKSIKQTLWIQCSNMSDLLKQTLLLQGQNMSTFFKTDFIVTMPRYVYLVLTLKS